MADPNAMHGSAPEQRHAGMRRMLAPFYFQPLCFRAFFPFPHFEELMA